MSTGKRGLHVETSFLNLLSICLYVQTSYCRGLVPQVPWVVSYSP
jgi:hypothetical protein